MGGYGFVTGESHSLTVSQSHRFSVPEFFDHSSQTGFDLGDLIAGAALILRQPGAAKDFELSLQLVQLPSCLNKKVPAVPGRCPTLPFSNVVRHRTGSANELIRQRESPLGDERIAKPHHPHGEIDRSFPYEQISK